jgi:hypothetical protein
MQQLHPAAFNSTLLYPQRDCNRNLKPLPIVPRDNGKPIMRLEKATIQGRIVDGRGGGLLKKIVLIFFNIGQFFVRVSLIIGGKLTRDPVFTFVV